MSEPLLHHRYKFFSGGEHDVVGFATIEHNTTPGVLYKSVGDGAVRVMTLEKFKSRIRLGNGTFADIMALTGKAPEVADPAKTLAEERDGLTERLTALNARYTDAIREFEAKGQAIEDALGPYRGQDRLVVAVKGLADAYTKAVTEKDAAKEEARSATDALETLHESALEFQTNVARRLRMEKSGPNGLATLSEIEDEAGEAVAVRDTAIQYVKDLQWGDDGFCAYCAAKKDDEHGVECSLGHFLATHAKKGTPLANDQRAY